jgi:hypothetical protein
VLAALAAVSLLTVAAACGQVATQPKTQQTTQTVTRPAGQAVAGQTGQTTTTKAPAASTASATAGGPAVFPVLKGPYLGQQPPDATPKVFAPGIVSTESHEFSCTFTPDGQEFFFARRHPTLNQVVLMTMRLKDGVLTVPEFAPFVENSMSFEANVTPDGKRLYFCSGKPIPGQAGPPMNILYVDREGDHWSAAKDPGAPLNPAKAMHVSVASSGNIYTTDISQGMGTEAIGFARKVDGGYKTLERLGAPIAAGVQSMYPFIAPDESYLIYGSGKPGGPTPPALLISFRKPDGAWGEPQPIDLGLDAGIPFVTADGKYLFFTAGERGKSDIYWVSASVIESLRPGQPKPKASR